MHAPGAAFSTAGGSDEAAAATLHGVPPAAYAEFSGQPDQEAPGDIAAMREALMKVRPQQSAAHAAQHLHPWLHCDDRWILGAQRAVPTAC